MNKTCLLIITLGVFIVIIMVGAAVVDHIHRADRVELSTPFHTVRSERLRS